LVGFWIVTGMASRADSLATMRLLLKVSNPFGVLITAAGITLTILGLATAFVIGRPILGPLQGSSVDWMFVATLLMLPIFGFLHVVYPRFSKRLRAALAGADELGQLTPEVAAAWADPAYRVARRYELGAVIVVFALMVAKPF
jgi:hypothetical protein